MQGLPVTYRHFSLTPAGMQGTNPLANCMQYWFGQQLSGTLWDHSYALGTDIDELIDELETWCTWPRTPAVLGGMLGAIA